MTRRGWLNSPAGGFHHGHPLTKVGGPCRPGSLATRSVYRTARSGRRVRAAAERFCPVLSSGAERKVPLLQGCRVSFVGAPGPLCAGALCLSGHLSELGCACSRGYCLVPAVLRLEVKAEQQGTVCGAGPVPFPTLEDVQRTQLCKLLLTSVSF